MPGEMIAEFVLEGSWTYDRALFYMFYKWDYEYADRNLDAMNTVIFASNRRDVMPATPAECRATMANALAYRFKYWDDQRRAATTEEARAIAYKNEMESYERRRTLLL